ncbi:MAG: 2-methylcitrate synthase [Chlamydiae bacterium]|nr:2-methylcitrate synthase [Chlamydiota bacterium]
MNEEVLFTVTKDSLETGLRGVPVGYCVTSSVHPENGLFYAGRPINEICSWEPEKVIDLLFRGREGREEEVTAFAHELKKRAPLDIRVGEAIDRLPREGHPMALFSAALLILGMFEQTGDYREDALHLIAKAPEVAARVIHRHAGWGKTPLPDLNAGYMESFFHLLQVPEKKESLKEVLQLFNVLHYDHGGGNLSAFVGKAVASGLEDLFGSLAAAMNALAGPRHGRANQECLHFVEESLESLGASASSEEVEHYIRERLSRKELIYGFGHAVLRVEDPRATLQYSLAQKEYGDHPLVRMALLIREAGTKVLKENPKINNPYPNVDAISGSLLTAAGFPYPEYYTVLFGLSRVVGIAIQIVYERCEAREGKGTPIVRPKYLYKKREI